ncbi:MAG: hypothetical protein GF421_10410 [Candidatus Aminicenantes bacterium]|nr:hypothetical protein [Candidatus Aminicenantes bacterium]
MNRSAKGRLRGIILSLSLFVCVLSLFSAYEKKLEITAEKAHVYLKPDVNSSTIGLLKKGDVVALASSIKIKKNWYYIYFSAANSDFTSSGYILDSSVNKLFRVTKVLHIDEERPQKNPYQSQIHFRNTRWGMNQTQVVFTEGRPVSRKKDHPSSTLTYESTLLDMECLLIYSFSHDRLVKAKYDFSKKYPIHNQSIEDLISIKKALTQKYGEPKEEKHFKEPPENSQKLLQTTRWETRETMICLYLYQNKEHIEMELEYTGLQFRNFGI